MVYNNFFGYSSREDAVKYWPQILNLNPTSVKKIRVCTRDKKCTGSLDGKEFMYEDGTVDYGIIILQFTYEIDSVKIIFFE